MGIGELFSITAAATWAYGVIIYKQLGQSLSPLALNLLKNLIVAAAMLPTVLLVHGATLPTLAANSWMLALLSGAVGISIADTLYFKSLNELGAGRLGVIGNLYSPFVVVMSYFVLDERLVALQIVGFVLVLGGVLLVNQPHTGSKLDAARLRRGAFYGVLAVLLNAVGIILVKRVLEQEPFFWVSLIRMLGALLVMVLFFLARPGWFRMPALREIPWRTLCLGALLGQYISMLLWLAGYKYATASVAAILNETASIFILLFAWWILGEQMSRRKWLGVSCTLVGVGVMMFS